MAEAEACKAEADETELLAKVREKWLILKPIISCLLVLTVDL